MRGAVVAAQCRTDTALTSCCSGGGPRQPWSSGLAPISKFHFSVPLSHSSPSLIGLLASVDVKQQKLTTPLGQRVLWSLILSPTLRALLYDILPSTTAVISYAIGLIKLSSYEQFFVGVSSKFVTNNSNYIRCLFYVAMLLTHSSNKTKIV